MDTCIVNGVDSTRIWLKGRSNVLYSLNRIVIDRIWTAVELYTF